MAIAERHLQCALRRRTGGSQDLCHRLGRRSGGRHFSHEAISLAGHLKPKGLIVLWDHNNITIDGSTSLSTSTDELKRFEAAGWITDSCDGQDAADVYRALAKAQDADGPVLIACRTIIGFGLPSRRHPESPFRCARRRGHRGARKTLGWDHPPFVIPDDLSEPVARHRRAAARRRVTPGTSAKPPASQEEGIRRRLSADVLPASLAPALIALKQKISDEKPVGRHAQIFRKGAGCHQCRTVHHHRRFGGPDAVQQHQDQEYRPRSRRAISPAAISITASASMAWRRR